MFKFENNNQFKRFKNRARFLLIKGGDGYTLAITPPSFYGASHRTEGGCAKQGGVLDGNGKLIPLNNNKFSFKSINEAARTLKIHNNKIQIESW